MRITLSKRIGPFAVLLSCALASSTTARAEINKLVIESDGSAQSRQHVAMEKERWSSMHNLRQRVNKRTEKGWSKVGAASDNRDKCKQSTNINICWESDTLRCLDRRTGRVITP